MNKIPNIKSFSEHGVSIDRYITLTEGSTEAAKEMEYVLVDAAGGDAGRKGIYKYLKPYAQNHFSTATPSIDLGKAILKKVGLSNTGGTGKNRMSANKYETNKQWLGRNKTPKTDIIINGVHISLKKGSSQIMSGGSDESLSTFNAALAALSKDKAFTAEYLEDVKVGIESLMNKHIGKSMGGIDVQKKGGKVYQDTKKKKGFIGNVKANSFDADDVLVDANNLNKNLTTSFQNLFNGSQDFKREFTFEAMTGKVKFQNNEGTAKAFLVVDFDGSADYHKVISSTDGYVESILSQVNPNVKFKSTSQQKKKADLLGDGITKTGHYRFWSTVGLMYKAVAKTQGEIYDMMNSGEVEYLSEGFFDFIKRAWNKFKTFVSSLVKKVINWVSQSAKNMMEYFELQPTIRFRNNIKW